MNHTNKHTWCIDAFHGFSTQNNGHSRPCCIYRTQDTSNQPVLGDTTIIEHFNSAEMLKLREDLKNGIRSPGCNKCWKEEDAGRESKRIRDNKKFTGLENGIMYVDMSLGNQCNIRCRTCGPHASSQWLQESYDTKYKNDVTWKDFTVQLSQYSKNYEEDGKFWEDFETHLSTIKQIDFYGGEPLLSKKMWSILQKAVDLNYAKDIQIHYVTNGTIWPKHTDLWKHFKQINIGFSVDGIDDQFEYMRYMAKWNDVKENIQRAKTFSDNIVVHWCVTLSNLNIFILPDIIEEWYKSFQGTGLFLNLVHYPNHFNIAYLPEDIKQIVINKLNGIPKSYKHVWSQLPGVIKFIENGVPNETHWTQFLEELKIHDDYRNQDYSKTFPEFAKIIGYSRG